MKKSLESSLDYKGKYYELRRGAKELIFENSAYQAEILECQKMIAQRERERELLLQHLLQYEQEAWELQSEMNSAHTEKHKLLKKQQEADKRKRVRLDTHLAEAAAIAQTEPDGSVSKIPKIKIVFQHKGPGIAPQGPQEPITKLQGPVLDINTEAKTAIKNKLKRNKLDPIVISLPSASMKDPLHQQSVKRPRPANLGLNLTPSGLIAASRASGLMMSPSLLSQSPGNILTSQHSQQSYSSSLPYSPGVDLNELLARASSDHTPIDVFSESDTSCNASPASMLRTTSPASMLRTTSPASMLRTTSPASMLRTTSPATLLQEDRLVMEDQDHFSMLSAFKRSPEVQGGFRISPSALRSIKQKIDSINASQSPWKAAAAKGLKSPNLPHFPSLEQNKKSNDS
ncbi:uncharacterized protein LOC134811600 [Bolinopsis microptera]|uniref:uncharacterized protein LOC134811600 n=1 Tax=Bolinopsis microptera TaxID=2820187 RepID=UPI00307B0259